MTTKKRIEELKARLLPILEKHNVKKASLFGSVVKGSSLEDSDIDILVELADELSLFDFIGLKNELEDSIEKKVDLVEYETIKEPLKEAILAEQVPILERA